MSDEKAPKKTSMREDLIIALNKLMKKKVIGRPDPRKTSIDNQLKDMGE
jgi:predicted metal-dependent RNase